MSKIEQIITEIEEYRAYLKRMMNYGEEPDYQHQRLL